MSDWDAPFSLSPFFVHTFGLQSAMNVAARQAGAQNPAALTWVANQAIFVPVVLPWPFPVARVFWANGSTITTSNADFGIYNADGTRLYSTGSKALAGASAIQYTAVATPFELAPGRYFFGYACDNTTSRCLGTALTTPFQRMAGILQQATAFPLPATMASAVAATQAIYELCGISRLASGF